MSGLDPAYEERYYALLKELRCLVCQNESIYESRAELAQDLRAEVRKMLERGASDADILNFMLARYGEFVLYKPRFKASTFLLWAGPWLLLGGGLYFGYRIWRRQSQKPATETLSDEQRRELARLADEEKKA